MFFPQYSPSFAVSSLLPFSHSLLHLISIFSHIFPLTGMLSFTLRFPSLLGSHLRSLSSSYSVRLFLCSPFSLPSYLTLSLSFTLLSLRPLLISSFFLISLSLLLIFSLLSVLLYLSLNLCPYPVLPLCSALLPLSPHLPISLHSLLSFPSPQRLSLRPSNLF